MQITRRLCREQSDLLEYYGGSDWGKWQLAETLRRTVHLVNVINILCCHRHTLSARYFEPLDDDLVLNLPLPSTDSLWGICTIESWNLRGQLGREDRVITPRVILEISEGVEVDGGRCVGSSINESEELTGLIVASMRLHRET